MTSVFSVYFLLGHWAVTRVTASGVDVAMRVAPGGKAAHGEAAIAKNDFQMIKIINNRCEKVQNTHVDRTYQLALKLRLPLTFHKSSLPLNRGFKL